MENEIQSIDVVEKFADKVRRMEINDAIEILDSERVSKYNQALRTVRAAEFTTRTIEGKLYLIRTS